MPGVRGRPSDTRTRDRKSRCCNAARIRRVAAKTPQLIVQNWAIVERARRSLELHDPNGTSPPHSSCGLRFSAEQLARGERRAAGNQQARNARASRKARRGQTATRSIVDSSGVRYPAAPSDLMSPRFMPMSQAKKAAPTGPDTHGENGQPLSTLRPDRLLESEVTDPLPGRLSLHKTLRQLPSARARANG